MSKLRPSEDNRRSKSTDVRSIFLFPKTGDVRVKASKKSKFQIFKFIVIKMKAIDNIYISA